MIISIISATFFGFNSFFMLGPTELIWVICCSIETDVKVPNWLKYVESTNNNMDTAM